MLRSLTIALALLLTTTALADRVKAPKAGTAHHALLDGLSLLKDGKFDAWIDRYCHPDKLCFSAGSKKSLLRYNLPAIKRLAPQCIKDGDSLEITRTDGDPAKDEAVKIFVLCNPKGMPRPFRLRKKGARWMFERI